MNVETEIAHFPESKIMRRFSRPTELLLVFPLILVMLFAVAPGHASADTVISSNITSTTTWTTAGNVYIISGARSISAGVTLTIEPGVIVKFQTTSSSLTVSGTLSAVGTSTSPIYFTSYKDDTGGDTNGDGGASSPTAGDWCAVIVGSGGTANLEHVIVRYGGYTSCSAGGSGANLRANSGVFNITTSTSSNAGSYGILNSNGTTTLANSVLAGNTTYGIRIDGGFASVATSSISSNGSYGIYASGGTASFHGNTFSSNTTAVQISDPDILDINSGNSATGGTNNGIVIGGTLNVTDKTLGADTMSYIVSGALALNSGRTLTINPGAVLKYSTGAVLTINGTLNALGTSLNPIYFTSLKDDTIIGDTNGNGAGTSPASGDWCSITVTSTGVANIQHATVRYGGNTGSCGSNSGSNILTNGGVLNVATTTVSNGVTYGSLQVSGTTTASNVTFSNSGTYGFRMEAGTSSIASSAVSSNGTYGVWTSGGALSITGSNFTNQTHAVYVQDPDYLVTSTGNSASGGAYNGTYISGTLNNNKTWSADTMPYIVHNVFVSSGKTLTINPGTVSKFSFSTSPLTVNGTLNVLGSSLYPIYFTSLKDDTILGDTNGDGGASSPAAGDWHRIEIASGGIANFEHSIIRYGGATSSSPFVYTNLYVNGGTLNIATSTIAHSSTYGIRQVSGTTTVSDSVIKNNGTYGAHNALTATSTFSATNNYWNSFSGPYHATLNPSGTGDDISSYISFDPWLGNTHYTFYPDDSVDDANEEMLWKWSASTESQDYATELAAAIATWNALDPITIAETGGAADIEVQEVDASPETWTGQYTALTPGLVELNLAQINGSEPLSRIQKTWTHELGHALGLNHSYWENVMHLASTTQTSLGNQDVEDYHYLWGY